MTDNSNRPERPRLEPEIIPPARGRRGSEWHQDVWPPYVSAGGPNTQRVYIAKFGPFGFAMLMFIIGIVAAMIVLAVVGAILVWIPILALLLAAGLVFRFLRR